MTTLVLSDKVNLVFWHLQKCFDDIIISNSPSTDPIIPKSFVPNSREATPEESEISRLKEISKRMV